MFFTFKQRVLLIIYTIIILSIPVGTYLISQYQTIRSRAEESKPTNQPLVKITPVPKSSPDSDLTNLSKADSTLEDLLKITPTPSPETTSSPTIATSFGPTLSLKAFLEGRPKDNQVTKLFVGIMEGILTVNPKFLLSFTVDLPASGEVGNLSLAGLNPGSTYTALLKGRAQIATSSAFVLSPNVTTLNDNQALIMLSGDLNEDNTINSSDYAIVKNSLGSTSLSTNWQQNADFNKDGLINTLDLAIVMKNLGQIGASGAWTSPLPKTATSSGGLIPESTQSPTSGYWLWVPGF